jgi:hypothetical protein
MTLGGTSLHYLLPLLARGTSRVLRCGVLSSPYTMCLQSAVSSGPRPAQLSTTPTTCHAPQTVRFRGTNTNLVRCRRNQFGSFSDDRSHTPFIHLAWSHITDARIGQSERSCTICLNQLSITPTIMLCGHSYTEDLLVSYFNRIFDTKSD